MDNPRFVFEKHKLFLYKEDYEKFVDALTRTLDVAKGNAPTVSPTSETSMAAEATATVETAPAETVVAAGEQDEAPAEKKSFLDKVKDIF